MTNASGLLPFTVWPYDFRTVADIVVLLQVVADEIVTELLTVGVENSKQSPTFSALVLTDLVMAKM